MTSVSGNFSAKSLPYIVSEEQTVHSALSRSPDTIPTTDIKCSSRLFQRRKEKLVVKCEEEHVVSEGSGMYQTVSAVLLSRVLLTQLCPACLLGRHSEPSIDLLDLSHTVCAFHSESSAYLRGKRGSVVHFRNGIGSVTMLGRRDLWTVSGRMLFG